MPTNLVNLVKIAISNSGPGALSLGQAVPGYRGSEALVEGGTYSYSIQNGNAWEFGRGTYLPVSQRFVRSPIGSSDGGTTINLGHNSQIAFVALAEDLDGFLADAQAITDQAGVYLDQIKQFTYNLAGPYSDLATQFVHLQNVVLGVALPNTGNYSGAYMGIAGTIAVMAAIPAPFDGQPIYVSGIEYGGQFAWRQGDYTGLADGVNIVASASIPIANGAWVRIITTQSSGVVIDRADFENTPLSPGEIVVDERGIPWFGNEGGQPGGVSYKATDDSNSVSRAMLDRMRDQAMSIMDAYLPTDPDFTNAARRVLATGKNLFLPSRVGGYAISDELVMSSGGQQIISYGAYHGYFHVTSNFNLSARGVITILPSDNERQSGLTNVGILFDQPAAPTSMDQIVKYPWAIYAPGVSRMSFNGVIRIEDAWNGLNFSGNVGGLVADDFEICAYNQAYTFDGAADSVHITTLKLWPFIAANTPQALALYYQGLGGYIGQIDGLDIKTIAHFGQPLIVDTTTGASGIGTIGAIQMDGAGSKLTWNNNGYRVGNVYSTASTAALSAIVVSGGFLSISGLYLQGGGRGVTATTSAPLIELSNGQLQVTNPFMLAIGPGQKVIHQTGGILDWDGGIFNTYSDLSYGVPLMHVTGGFASIDKPRFLPISTSGNVALKVETDNYHDVEINALTGWARSVPATVTTSTFRFGSTLIGGPPL